MSGWDRFNQIANWMVRIAFLNFLWILFTVIGLGVFGLFPSTAAMFAVTRKWLVKKETDFSMVQVFWEQFRKGFFTLNGFALLFALVGYLLYYDFTFIQMNSGKLPFMIPVLLFILLSYILALLFFFPVFVHFEMKFFQYLKQVWLIAINSPVEALLMIVSAVLLYFFISFLPGTIPLFSGSGMALLMTWISSKAFARIERKQTARSTISVQK